MEELLEQYPLVAGVAAVIAVYVIFKLIGLFTFLLRLGLAAAIGIFIFYYYIQ